MDLSILQLSYIGAAALIVGFSKTSVGGLGILAVPLVALAVAGKSSPGVLLPMLIIADIMAVVYYRRSCQWQLLVRLLPMSLIGVAIGFAILRVLPDYEYEKVIGGTILAMLVLDLAMTETAKRLFRGKLMTAIAGVVAGFASLIANAAGPIFGLYLLQQGLKKSEFVGTRSWFFLLLNTAKVPFSAGLGLISVESLAMNMAFIPVILAGAFLGVKFLKYINLQMFSTVIRVAVLISAVRLIAF